MIDRGIEGLQFADPAVRFVEVRDHRPGVVVALPGGHYTFATVTANGHKLDLSYGQEVWLTVERAKGEGRME